MGQPISYFNNYHTKENIITNYCGLMLKMIYDDNIGYFEEIVNSMIAPKNVSIQMGPQFLQQVKKNKSIPDLCISQQSFNIFFETKISDWFHSDQLNNHISGFDKASSTNILILLCDEYKNISIIDEVVKKAATKNIYVAPITYEDFIALIEIYCKSEFLSKQFEEFYYFLDKQKLLQTWKNRLDVVNCVSCIEEINKGFYICPDVGRTYAHRRAMYFGAYKDKTVKYLCRIEAVASVSENMGKVEIKWNNGTMDEREIQEKARKYIQEHREDENRSKPMQVFILSNCKEVHFVKQSSGGLWGSKIYFENIAKDCQNIDELANIIDGQTWDKFGR